MRRSTLALAVLAACHSLAHADVQLGTVEVSDAPATWRTGGVGVGTFRDTPAKEIPLTVNVIDRDLLDAQQANSVYEALKNTAGVTRSQLGASAYDNISIRGLLVENRSNYRLNGGLPIINLIDLPLENKEKVEVLKGVGGLYYGFVPPSGIINLVTKRAGKEPVTSVGLAIDSNGGAIASMDLGRRFGERQEFGLRVNAAGGAIESPVQGANGNRQFFATAFDWRVSDRWLLKLDFEHIEKKAVEQSSIKVLPAVNGKITLPSMPDPSRRIAPEWADYDAKANNIQVRSDFSLSDDWVWSVELGEAHTRRDRNYSQLENYNLASGEGTLRISRTQGQDYRNRNFRTELLGRVQTGGVAHDLTLGYSRNDLDQSAGATRSQSVAQNLYNPRPIAYTTVTYPTAQPYYQTTDQGIYAFDRMDFGSWLLMAGLRTSRFGYNHPTQTYEKQLTSPTAAVVWRFSPRTNLYAGYLEGLEDGGSAPAGTSNEYQPMEPLVSKQWEMGIKTDLGKVQTNAALFTIDRPMNGTNSLNNTYERLGEGQYRGIELSASGELAPRWMAYASTQWLEAEFTSAANDSRLIGKRPANTPTVTASLFVEHRLAAVPGLALSAGAYYTGERAVDPLNQAFVPGFTRYDLGARYRTRVSGKPLDLSANLENLADERYWAAAGDSRVNSNSPVIAMGMPRTLRLAAKLSF